MSAQDENEQNEVREMHTFALMTHLCLRVFSGLYSGAGNHANWRFALI